MKRTVTSVLCVVLSALYSGAHSVGAAAQEKTIPSAAYEAGRSEALADVANGKLVYRYFGMPALHDEVWRETLTAEYKIEPQRVAGCEVDDELLERTRGYNDISVAAIEQRYGEGILKKTEERAAHEFLKKIKPPIPPAPVAVPERLQTSDDDRRSPPRA